MSLTPTPAPATPTRSDEELTRYDSGDALTRFADQGEAQTIAVPLTREPPDDALTIAAAPGTDALGDAMTIANPGSVADAMTVATPVSSTPGVTPVARRPRRSADGDTGPLEVGQSFGPRYHVIRLLGIGGMGAVYQAWDAELGVAVAIKVIRPEVMDDPVTAAEVSRRFKRELLLARQVTHKNVVRIHDLGDIDGIKYITMSYVEGTDLSTILKRDGKQPVREVLKIARSVISGLVAAHTAGVVHRDLKPANIMIGGDGEALIMDFGIAHSTGDAAAPAPGAGLIPENLRRAATQNAATTVGSIVGTLEYMAPEQAKGQPIDQRADVYAFGLILYDILLGRRRASSGHSAVEELQRRMTAPPPPLQVLEKDIPPAVAALVARCVEPDAEKRFQTSAEVAAELGRLDDEGKVIPIARRLTRRVVIAATLLVAALLTATFYVTRQAVAPAKTHDPVTVLIADLENRTGEPSFDRTLEPIMKLALEGASFISAYDRGAISRNLGAGQIPQKLDEKAARILAVQQGIGLVISGSVDRRGTGYTVAVKAVQTKSGEVLTTEDRRASTKEQVPAAITDLASDLRSALGDEDSAKYAGMETLTVTSLDAVSHYVAGMDAQLNQRYEEAIRRFTMAVGADPNFGYAYAAMSTAARNLSKLEDAEKYAKTAMSQVGRMTEREKMRARGLYFMTSGDYEACRKEFTDLVAKFPADDAAHNNLAVCSTRLRGFERSLEARRRAVAILPNRPVYRSNLSFDATYYGEFATGEQEARKAQEVGSPVSGSVALAFAQLAQGRASDAIATYGTIGATDSVAASRASAGLGELALYEGRLKEAVEILERGAAADLIAKQTYQAAQKLVSVGLIQVMRKQQRAGVAAAEAALQQSQSVKVRFLAAQVFVGAGQIPAAQKLAASLGSDFEVEPRALAKVIDGEIALKGGNPRLAINVLNEANNVLDTWIGRFDLGRAYLEAGLPAQAEGEFDRCYRRRGESLSLFLDDQPTFGYLPLLLYYRGRVFEELKTTGFAESYRDYLNIRGKAGEDPLLPEVRKRAAGS